MKVTDEMVHAACAAQDGPRWREFNASLEGTVRDGLEAALATSASVKVLHWYGADVTATDVRAALEGVTLDTEAPDALNASDGLRGLLYRLKGSANQADLPADARLAWASASAPMDRPSADTRKGPRDE